MKIYNTKSEHYRLYIYTYGLISVLFVLENFILKEMYEECDKIIQAIKIHENLLGEKLFTEINPENIREITNKYKEMNCPQWNDEKTFLSCLYYSTLIIEEIESKY